jgi:hypothetical protein
MKGDLLNLTNGEAIASGFVPCEINPLTGMLSRTLERFHAEATVTVKRDGESFRDGRVRVCEQCKKRYIPHRRGAKGVVFP